MTLDTASAVAPFFSASRFTAARKLRGLRKSDLARLIKLSPAAITQIENGGMKPSAQVIARVAVALAFPVSFFAAEPGSPIATTSRPFFRSLRSARQVDLEQAAAYAGLIHELVRYMERHVILPDVHFPDYTIDRNAGKDVIEKIAGQLRREWGIESGPMPHVVRYVELNGGVVVRRLIGKRELDAFSCWYDRRPVVMLSSDKHDIARQRFDAAHEIGHLVMHADAEPGTHLTEHQAHSFAAAFLMPADEIADELPRRLDWPRFGHLKQKWGVSLAALLFRARELGTLSETTYRRAMVKYNQLGWRHSEPFELDFDEAPSILPRAVEVLRESGIEAAALCSAGFPVDFLSEVFSESNTSKPRLSLEEPQIN